MPLRFLFFYRSAAALAGEHLLPSPWKPLVRRVRGLLLLGSGSGGDPWLWEFSERVMQTAHLLAHAPELQGDPPDETALLLAGLFAQFGWAEQVRQGQIEPAQVLSRPTNDLQREMAAAALAEHVGDDFPAESRELALQTLRECNNRFTRMPEARVLAEAESLADIGAPYLLRQLRRYQAEGRGLRELLASWARQREYAFWDARIKEGLRFELSREVARDRLEAADAWLRTLGVQASADDLRAAVAARHIEPAPFDFERMF